MKIFIVKKKYNTRNYNRCYYKYYLKYIINNNYQFYFYFILCLSNKRY